MGRRKKPEESIIPPPIVVKMKGLDVLGGIESERHIEGSVLYIRGYTRDGQEVYVGLSAGVALTLPKRLAFVLSQDWCWDRVKDAYQRIAKDAIGIDFSHKESST